jgi:gluconolactonase
MSARERENTNLISRRGAVKALGTVAGAALISDAVFAQRPTPPTVISTPPRDFSQPTTYFSDPDILTVDPQFDGLVQPNSAIKQLWTGGLWLEGPAWSSIGRFLVFSDIPNNVQMRWLEDDGRVTVFRNASNNSNGNTFDFQGRQLSCEHLMRRIVRYEHDGSATIIADKYDGKRLNSPNDIVAHPDGSYWFTDPPYGGQLFEGQPDAAGGASNTSGRLNPRLGQPPDLGNFKRELPNGVYRVDPSGRVDLVAGEDVMPDPNGLVFSPDHKKLYIVSFAKGPGDTGPGGNRSVYSFEVGANNKLGRATLFADFTVDGVKCAPDGIKCDVDGNLWCGSNAGRAVGYNGVTIWNPQGKLIGRIRLPEVCANIAFGGPKRNRLFMCASQSLYAVYVGTQGAGPA